MDSYDKVLLARDGTRPNLRHYISRLFTDFFEQKGDRSCRDDGAIIGGIALLEDRPITVLGHQKGASLEENVQCNFGMPGPEGYRKALRIMEQAEKYGHSRTREYAFLIAHSMLHLFGYDHMVPEEARVMEAKQAAILESLNILR